MDKDLSSRQEARTLCAQAGQAQARLARFSQEQLNAITKAVADAFSKEAVRLAEMAVSETGFGNVTDKTEKNRFASQDVLEAIEGIQTVGILHQTDTLWEIGVPMGVIAGVVPSTNPTSTVCYKSLIALKSGNAIVFSPHPSAAKCTLEAARVVAQAAEKAGCPKGAVACLTIPSMEGCQELMRCPEVRLILATGGPGLVKAAYSSGTPAIGVGAGNGPAYLHRSCDISKAVEKVFRSKTFDNGTVCASEQSIIVEAPQQAAAEKAIEAQGGYFLPTEDAKKLSAVLFRGNGSMNPQTVGRTPAQLADLAGIRIPKGTRVLLGRENGVGPKHPFSQEKLCPVLGFFVEENEDAVLNRVKEILQHEGRGHTFTIHASDEAVIRRFSLEVPVSRFLVNMPAVQGGIGAESALFPAMTLGCGAVGGSSSSNNVGPLDLINLRRVAFPVQNRFHRKGIPVQSTSGTTLSPELLSALTAALLERLS